MTRGSMLLSICFGLLIFIKFNPVYGASNVNNGEKSALNIAVIGAGPSGLASAKNAIDHGHKVTIYEQSVDLGGVWLYTDQTGKDEYGVNIHTAMYQGLRTNLPLQMMELPGHHYPNGTKPFPSQGDVLRYLHSYADQFNLRENIKLSHLVVRVLPIENDKWEVIVKDLPNGTFSTNIYDAVFVCNGRFAKAYTPEIEGADQFKGKIIHSHDFRSAEAFRGERVLIIGAGISGVDISIHLSKVAEEVTLSQRKKTNETPELRKKRQDSLPPKTVLKDNVKRITTDGAEFIDGTKETFNAIIYATGYNFSFPFLSVESGIHVDDSFVQPLYKHIFNIQHPTMAFIGIPIAPSTFRMFDLQARFALKFLSGEKKLPSKDEMLTNLGFESQIQWDKGFPKSKTHFLIYSQREYFNQLSKMADVENIPIIFDAIYYQGVQKDILEHPTQIQKYKYTIIDDETFTKEKYED